MRLLESLGSDLWWWLRVFTVDVLIYQGRLAEAARDLRHTLTQRHTSMQPTAFISTNLKLASVFYALNNLSVRMFVCVCVFGCVLFVLVYFFYCFFCVCFV